MWAMVKPWLHPVTRSYITLISSSSAQQVLPVSAVPAPAAIATGPRRLREAARIYILNL
jgi:hypothetical protein